MRFNRKREEKMEFPKSMMSLRGVSSCSDCRELSENSTISSNSSLSVFSFRSNFSISIVSKFASFFRFFDRFPFLEIRFGHLSIWLNRDIRMLFNINGSLILLRYSILRFDNSHRERQNFVFPENFKQKMIPRSTY